MGSLSSQTKCNTFLWRCCHGADLSAALPGRSMRDCPAFCQWQLGPANRGSSGSLGINDFSGAEAQSWCPGWVQIQLRSAADAGAALEGMPTEREAGLRAAVMSGRSAGRRSKSSPARARAGAQGDLLREHLPLHLCPAGPYQGLSLAALSAARQEQTRLPGQEGRRPPNFIEGRFRGKPTDRVDRMTCGHWESRSDDVRKIWSGDPDCA